MSWAESTGVERQGLKPPAFFNQSYICLSSFNHGFSKVA